MPLRGAIGLDDLRLFYLIVEVGSVSGASRRFGHSKATLSRALARLEDRAGGPLFDRMSDGVKLTPSGETLVDAARRATEAGAKADEVLRAVTKEPGGTLRVAASAVSGHIYIGPVVARMTREFPNLSTHVIVTAAGPDPMAEDLDVVIRLGRPEEPYLVARKIATEPIRLFCGMGFAEDNDIDDPTAVQMMPRICIDVPGVPTEWNLRSPDGDIFVCERPFSVYAGDPIVALGLVSNDAGVSMLPQAFGVALVEEGRLRPVLPDYTIGEVEIFAVFPPGRAQIPAVRVFIDYLIDHARELRL